VTRSNGKLAPCYYPRAAKTPPSDSRKHSGELCDSEQKARAPHVASIVTRFATTGRSRSTHHGSRTEEVWSISLPDNATPLPRDKTGEIPSRFRPSSSRPSEPKQGRRGRPSARNSVEPGRQADRIGQVDTGEAGAQPRVRDLQPADRRGRRAQGQIETQGGVASQVTAVGRELKEERPDEGFRKTA